MINKSHQNDWTEAPVLRTGLSGTYLQFATCVRRRLWWLPATHEETCVSVLDRYRLPRAALWVISLQQIMDCSLVVTEIVCWIACIKIDALNLQSLGGGVWDALRGVFFAIRGSCCSRGLAGLHQRRHFRVRYWLLRSDQIPHLPLISLAEAVIINWFPSGPLHLKPSRKKVPANSNFKINRLLQGAPWARESKPHSFFFCGNIWSVKQKKKS